MAHPAGMVIVADNLPAIPEPDPRLSMELQALPERWQAFVVALVETGCTVAEAAKRAGYGSAGKLAHDPRIQAAIHAESIRRVGTHVPLALSVLVEVASNRAGKAADRVRAAEAILDRGGMARLSEQKITVTHQLSEAEQDQEILSLARELNLDRAATEKLLGHVIEAEFTEIPTTPNVNGPGGVGRPISKPDRGDDLRTFEREYARVARNPEAKAERAAEFARRQCTRGQEGYVAFQELQRARELGFEDAFTMHVALGSEGIEDLLGDITDLINP